MGTARRAAPARRKPLGKAAGWLMRMAMNEVVQDVSVMLKAAFAGAAVLALIDSSSITQCDSWTVKYNTEAATDVYGTVKSSVVQDKLCFPDARSGPVQDVFITLLVAGQMLFAAAIALRHQVPCPSLAPVLGYSLGVASVTLSLAEILAVCFLPFVQTEFPSTSGVDFAQQRFVTVELSDVGISGCVGETCEQTVDCQDKCGVSVDVEAYLLVATALISALYVLYLANEYVVLATSKAEGDPEASAMAAQAEKPGAFASTVAGASTPMGSLLRWTQRKARVDARRSLRRRRFLYKVLRDVASVTKAVATYVALDSVIFQSIVVCSDWTLSDGGVVRSTIVDSNCEADTSFTDVYVICATQALLVLMSIGFSIVEKRLDFHRSAWTVVTFYGGATTFLFLLIFALFADLALRDAQFECDYFGTAAVVSGAVGFSSVAASGNSCRNVTINAAALGYTVDETRTCASLCKAELPFVVLVLLGNVFCCWLFMMGLSATYFAQCRRLVEQEDETARLLGSSVSSGSGGFASGGFASSDTLRTLTSSEDSRRALSSAGSINKDD